MSLQTQLSNLTAAIAGKLNDLNAAAEKNANKKQDLLSVDTNHYPSVPAVNAGLDLKVDKVAGKQLSDENYSLAEKNKLAGLESSKYRGLYTGADSTALPATGNTDGSYADLDSGVTSEPTTRWIWDNNDSVWIEQVGASTQMTNSEVKTAYEANPDTNAYSDAEKTKLAGIEDGATGDMTAGEIKTAYEANANTNAFTDANVTELSNAVAHGAATNNPHGVTKAQVGLGNVDNTSDAAKPVSTAQAAAIQVVQDDVDALEVAVGDTAHDFVTEFNTAINY